MKKYLIWLLVMMLSVFIVWSGISCKGSAVTSGEETVSQVSTSTEVTTEKEEATETLEEAKEHGAEVKSSPEVADMLSKITPGPDMQKAIDDAKKHAGETIKVMVSGDCAIDSLEPITRNFEKLTGVKVELNIVSWDVLMPQGPIAISTDEYSVDVIDTWDPWLDEYAPQSRYVDLSQYLSNEYNAILPQLKKDMTVGGKQYAFPFMASWELMYYNKDLVAKAGLDPNKPPTTMDELNNWIKTLSLDTNNDGQIDRYGFLVDLTVDYGAPNFQMFYKAFGGKPCAIDGENIKMTLDTPEMKAAMNEIKWLVDNGLLSSSALTGSQWDITSMYESEQVPLFLVWEMYRSYMNKDILAKTGYFAFPGSTKGTYASTNGHENFGIPISAKNKEAAMAYIKFCGSQEVQKIRTIWNGTSPCYANLWTDPEILAKMPHLTEVAKEIQFETPRTWPVYGSLALVGEMMKELQNAVVGTKTIDEACADLQATADNDYKIIPGVASRYADFLK